MTGEFPLAPAPNATVSGRRILNRRTGGLMTQQPKPSLHQRLKAAGCELDHHGSDLYFKASPTSRDVMEQFYRDVGEVVMIPFEQDDGSFWIEIKGAYDPSLEAKGK